MTSQADERNFPAEMRAIWGIPSPGARPIKAAHELLLTKLAALTDFTPQIHIDPSPRDFEDVNDYLCDAARIFDQWLAAVGVDIKANAPCRIDESVFKDRFLNAIEGEATAEITRCAERVKEDRAAA